MLDSKVLPLDAAIHGIVSPQMHLHFALAGGRPNGSMRELARQFEHSDPQFTVSAPSIGGIQLGLMLIEAGLVRRVVTAFLGDGYPVPKPSPRAKRRVDDGSLEIEERSLYKLLLRLRAGAQGLPVAVSRSLVDSDLGERRVRRVEVDGQRLALVPALTPDVTFVHGVVSDPDGNTVLSSPLGEGIAGAAAARYGSVVTTEEVVSRKEFRRYAGLPILPGAFVRSVSELRFGAHPSGVFAPLVDRGLDYADDYDAIEAATHALNGDDDALAEYLATTFSVDPDAYRERVGTERLRQLQHGTPDEAPAAAGDPHSASRSKRLVVNAAQIVARHVLVDNPDHVLAGVGLSSLGCWLAASRDDSFPPLISELGFYDYTPQPGNPFLFAYPNMANTSALAGIDELLGYVVQGTSTRTLAVLAAGQVDDQGNINTSRIGDSGWLTGSGGASDIAVGAESVIVVLPHRAGRLVSKVDHVTSPGFNTRWIVTDRAAMSLEPGRSPRIEAVVCGPGMSVAEAAHALRRDLPWEVELAVDVYRLEDPSDVDGEMLQSHDPRGFFLGKPDRSAPVVKGPPS